MSPDKPTGFEMLDGYPADILAISAHGRITAADYETVLIPAFQRILKEEGKVKLLYVLGDSFEGVTAGAAWDDAKLGLLHMGDFARVAIVTDVEWIRLGVKMFAPFMRCPVHLFTLSEAKEAKAWILDDNHDSDPGSGVAVEKPMSTMGDVA